MKGIEDITLKKFQRIRTWAKASSTNGLQSLMKLLGWRDKKHGRAKMESFKTKKSAKLKVV